MALSTTVIVNGINNLSDARYCAAMGVTMLGFELEPTDPDYVSAADFKEISGWVSGVELVGQFRETPAEKINEAVDTYGLNLVQLNTLYLHHDVAAIKVPVILRLQLNQGTLATQIQGLMDMYREAVTFFLLTSHDFTSIDQTDAAFLAQLAAKFPILLGFGLEKEKIVEILDRVKPRGIGLTGGTEIRPGLKDFDALQDILEELELDD